MIPRYYYYYYYYYLFSILNSFLLLIFFLLLYTNTLKIERKSNASGKEKLFSGFCDELACLVVYCSSCFYGDRCQDVRLGYVGILHTSCILLLLIIIILLFLVFLRAIFIRHVCTHYRSNSTVDVCTHYRSNSTVDAGIYRNGLVIICTFEN